MCAASRHNLSKSVGVEEANGSPWEHAEVAKRRSIKGRAPSKSSAGQREREKQTNKKGKKRASYYEDSDDASQFVC